MDYQDLTKNKLAYCRIKGQTRPFIDNNLQLQWPSLEHYLDQQKFYKPIYSHTSTFFDSFHWNSSLNFQQAEIAKAIATARQAYKTWQLIQQQLKETLRKNKLIVKKIEDKN
jgi:hypothetical protein